MAADASIPRETHSWRPDRAVYIRDHLFMGCLGAIGATALLYYMGDADYWVGVPASLLAIGVRGWYVASEELGMEWALDSAAVSGSNGKRIPLGQIERVRSIGSAVQIVTKGGDKHLLKYMADTAAVKTAIARAAGVAAT